MQSVADIPAANKDTHLVFNFDLNSRSWLAGIHALTRDVPNAQSRFFFDCRAIWKVHSLLVANESVTIAYMEEITAQLLPL
jgi:hypothetical protein